MPADARLVVVANRLPVSRRSDGRWETSPGGLVSALTPILQQRDGVWVGWTGIPGDTPKPFSHDGIDQRPVPISDEEIETFYEGFCNATIWPLYHDAIRTTEFHRHWWRPYLAVNRRFADAAAGVVRSGDLVWVQDYHLQLVPAMLRELNRDLRIGFFLHTPFPPEEIFARLPWRRAVLEGMLGADVVGFQTRLARNNFRRAADRFTEAARRGDTVTYQGRDVLLQSAPIAIDAQRYESLALDPESLQRAKAIRSELGNPRTVILGVDRLDYTKGIDVRLRALEAFLERQPEAAKSVVFVQIAVPSREGVAQYTQMRTDIEQLVGRINGRFATGGRVPVHYLYRSLPTEELVPYYLAADVMAVTPLRDGMNLVALEYVACRTDNTGVLLLSEFAGSAEALRHAIICNPYDLDGVAATMQAAVELPADEARRRMAALRRHVRRNDVYLWADGCLDAIAASGP